MALMDLHCHLCECEVIGLMAGQIRRKAGSQRVEIIVERAYPVEELQESQVSWLPYRGRQTSALVPVRYRMSAVSVALCLPG